MELKSIYYCATSGQKWGKGLTIKEAKKNAYVKTTNKSLQYYVMAAVFKNLDDADLELATSCVVAHQIDGSPMLAFDTDEKISKRMVGWLMIEKNF